MNIEIIDSTKTYKAPQIRVIVLKGASFICASGGGETEQLTEELY